MRRVVIVGNGYAGLSAARVLSSVKGLSVTVVSGEPRPACCLHLLPEVAAGRKAPADLELCDAGEYGRLGAVVMGGVRAESVSARTGIALLSTGEELPFDCALLATGSRPCVPEIFLDPMRRCGNVFAMRRMDEALALRKCIEGGARDVVIVGAGRIGVLLAEALKDLGVTTTLIDLAPQILATMLSPDVAARLRPELEGRGNTRVLTGTPVARVVAEGGRAREIVLSGGARVPCDAVVVAAGVVPNREPLDGDLSCPDGVLVDRRMETAAPGVYAAGDVVAFETLSGRREAGQLILNARAQGDAAARNMAGGNVSCPPSFAGNVVKIGPLTGARVGEIEGSGRAEFAVGGSFVRLTLEGSEVTGLQFVGQAGDLSGLVPAVLKKFDVRELSFLANGGAGFGLAPLLAARGARWA